MNKRKVIPLKLMISSKLEIISMRYIIEAKIKTIEKLTINIMEV